MGGIPKVRDRQWEKLTGWWLDHLVGSFIVAVFNPLLTFFSWFLVLPGGTALRFAVERQDIRRRRDAFKAAWIMVAVQAAIYTPLAAMDELFDLGGYLFGLLFFTVFPSLLYAGVMPLAGQRWFSFSRFRWVRVCRSLERPTT
jgi:hypothetical protein